MSSQLAKLIDEKVEFLTPRVCSVEDVCAQTTLPIFSDAALSFINALSRAILRNTHLRQFPELIAFGHWMRRRNILSLKENLFQDLRDRCLVGRGVALHIAPANVDTIFLYSVLLSLLCGNINIVRLSSRRSEQLETIVELISNLLKDESHKEVAQRLIVLRYERSDSITGDLSKLADLRVLWGGDTTVSSIRKLPAKPHTSDVCFPDRWSLAVFNADDLVEFGIDDELVRHFANDSYWFGQQACSSPRLVIWRGKFENCRQASEVFWSKLSAAALHFSDDLLAVDYVNKLVAVDEMSIRGEIASSRVNANNLLSVVDFAKDALPQLEHHCGAGLFFQASVSSLKEIAPLLESKTQTVVSEGITKSEWLQFITECKPTGISRIVPVGEALNFSSIWDGMDLLREFTREITIHL
ncbi:Acyl-CoA reductase (LuxC) [Pseudovibrio denitrificans]|uniref:Acyl-CoA reductase (LuxC) n=1 Tax=Pseudovibrio denitrificans TaxID=258256 RepID=A0A1I7CTN8_9HYPH|nr:acyl-CoA reductase [Pseudovibrio denitrificans]SFU02772.1 Acyl-CoA reductase (LuxC) [Pseudovibrio denitrificans]